MEQAYSYNAGVCAWFQPHSNREENGLMSDTDCEHQLSCQPAMYQCHFIQSFSVSYLLIIHLLLTEIALSFTGLSCPLTFITVCLQSQRNVLLCHQSAISTVKFHPIDEQTQMV